MSAGSIEPDTPYDTTPRLPIVRFRSAPPPPGGLHLPVYFSLADAIEAAVEAGDDAFYDADGDRLSLGGDPPRLLGGGAANPGGLQTRLATAVRELAEHANRSGRLPLNDEGEAVLRWIDAAPHPVYTIQALWIEPDPKGNGHPAFYDPDACKKCSWLQKLMGKRGCC